MRQKQLPPDDPQTWLRRARSNLIHGRHRLPGVYLEDLCFDAQQAAEKAVKALLIHLGVRFPYTHDLADLLTLVEKQELPIPTAVREATILTAYAVETRYPGVGEPVTDEEYEQAIAIAEGVVQWVETIVEG